MDARKLIVMYDFTAEHSEELSAHQSEVLIGLNLTPEKDWWIAENMHGNQGFVPVAYCNEIGMGSLEQFRMELASHDPNTEVVHVVDTSYEHRGSVVAKTGSLRLDPLAVNAILNPMKDFTVETNTSLKDATGEISASQGVTKSVGELGQIKHKPPAISLWGRNLALISSIFGAYMGFISFLWAQSTDISGVAQYGSELLGIFALVANILILLFEILAGSKLSSKRTGFGMGLDIRGILYCCIGMPGWFSLPTAIPSATLFVAGITFIMASLDMETTDKVKSRPKKKMNFNFISSLKDYLSNIREDPGKLGEFVILSIYASINIYLYLDAHVYWTNQVAALRKMNPRTAPSDFAPLAKGFGMLLNFNCSLIIFPVLRSFLRLINNSSVDGSGGFFAFIFQKISHYVPLMKNIQFHKLIAKVAGLSATGHIACHFMNFTTNPQILEIFGLTPWVTGAFITLAMIGIYSAAPDPVRRANFQIFWWNHNLFIVYFSFLLFHGLKNLVFLKYGSISIFLYVLERIFRHRRGDNVIIVKRIKFVDPVMEIRFCPSDKEAFSKSFKAGQYLFLNCPLLAGSQWHPFTISSCPSDLNSADNGFVSVHIKIQQVGGWTWKLKKFFQNMNPTQQYPFLLTRIENGQRMVGKTTNADGTAMLRVDGPHAAPCQHYIDYKCSIIIGAGIGLTPVSSIMRSSLFYKWRKGFRPEVMYFSWVVRHSEILSFQWFLQLLQQVTLKVYGDRISNTISTENHLEIHIYITGMKNLGPDIITPGPNDIFEPDIQELTYKMLNASVPSKDLVKYMRNPADYPHTSHIPNTHHNDIYIWNGRPDWNQFFSHVRTSHEVRESKKETTDFDIGVCFCGTKIIGKDLQKMCTKYRSFSFNTAGANKLGGGNPFSSSLGGGNPFNAKPSTSTNQLNTGSSLSLGSNPFQSTNTQKPAFNLGMNSMANNTLRSNQSQGLTSGIGGTNSLSGSNPFSSMGGGVNTLSAKPAMNSLGTFSMGKTTSTGSGIASFNLNANKNTLGSGGTTLNLGGGQSGMFSMGNANKGITTGASSNPFALGGNTSSFNMGGSTNNALGMQNMVSQQQQAQLRQQQQGLLGQSREVESIAREFNSIQNAYNPSNSLNHFQYFVYNKIPHNMPMEQRALLDQIPMNVDMLKWKQALNDNPDPDTLYTQVINSCKELADRSLEQLKRIQGEMKCIPMAETCLLQSETISKINETMMKKERRMHHHLSKKLLKTMLMLEVMLSQDRPLSEDVRMYDDILREASIVLNSPGGLEAQVAHLKHLKELEMARKPPSTHISESDTKRIIPVLNTQGEALAALTSILQKDLRDIEIMSNYPQYASQY